MSDTDLFDRRGWLHRWRMRRIPVWHLGDTGLMLLALWLFTKLAPGIAAVSAAATCATCWPCRLLLPFSAPQFLRLEASITASHLLAVGLLARSHDARAQPPWSIGMLVLLGLAAKTLAASSFFVPGQLSTGYREGRSAS